MRSRLAVLVAGSLISLAVAAPAEAAAPDLGAQGLKLFKTYHGDGDWQSPTVKLKKRDYRATVKYTCTDSSGGFMYLSWNGDQNGYESAHSSKARDTVTLNGHKGAMTGYFKVSTWIDCDWTVKVYQ
ncbi:hypothetical protein [Actinoplanes sp. HUAS TT8]|uniref:hypothetical protein n=1 Tax=Actinoplanes sp. HUAS TT8 TaxID=3447453 RepID=UPI003F51E5AE